MLEERPEPGYNLSLAAEHPQVQVGERVGAGSLNHTATPVAVPDLSCLELVTLASFILGCYPIQGQVTMLTGPKKKKKKVGKLHTSPPIWQTHYSLMITTAGALPSTSHKLILLESNPVTTQNRHLPPDAPFVKLLGQESGSHTNQKKPFKQLAGVTLLERDSLALSSCSPSATSGRRKREWDFELKKIAGGTTKAKKRSHSPSDRPRTLHICPWAQGSRYRSLPVYASAVSSAGSSMGHLLPDLSTKSLKSHLSRGLEAGEAAACNRRDVLGERVLQGGHVGMRARPDQLRMHSDT